MGHTYTKVFTNPYPSGWRNLPSIQTPIIAQALQQHTNAIVAIEEYLALTDIPTKISELINDSITVPTKTSDLVNDSNYITLDDLPAIPSKMSELDNDLDYVTRFDISEFVTEDDVPKKVSDLINDLDYVNTSVTNLMNYYLKTETYSKIEVQNLLSRIKEFNIEVVNELPSHDISDNTIYLVPKELDNMVMVNNYAMSLDDHIVNPNIEPFIVGDPVTTIQEVGDPFA